MTIPAKFKEYIWLVNTIRNAGISYKEHVAIMGIPSGLRK